MPGEVRDYELWGKSHPWMRGSANIQPGQDSGFIKLRLLTQRLLRLSDEGLRQQRRKPSPVCPVPYPATADRLPPRRSLSTALSSSHPPRQGTAARVSPRGTPRSCRAGRLRSRLPAPRRSVPPRACPLPAANRSSFGSSAALRDPPAPSSPRRAGEAAWAAGSYRRWPSSGLRHGCEGRAPSGRGRGLAGRPGAVEDREDGGGSTPAPPARLGPGSPRLPGAA